MFDHFVKSVTRITNAPMEIPVIFKIFFVCFFISNSSLFYKNNKISRKIAFLSEEKERDFCRMRAIRQMSTGGPIYLLHFVALGVVEMCIFVEV